MSCPSHTRNAPTSQRREPTMRRLNDTSRLRCGGRDVVLRLLARGKCAAHGHAHTPTEQQTRRIHTRQFVIFPSSVSWQQRSIIEPRASADVEVTNRSSSSAYNVSGSTESARLSPSIARLRIYPEVKGGERQRRDGERERAREKFHGGRRGGGRLLRERLI